MKNAKKTQSAGQRRTKTGSSAPGKTTSKTTVRVARNKSAAPSPAASSIGAEQLVARSIFGQTTEIHRPRLVLFVGTPADTYAPVSALWFGALAAESKATIVLAYADSAPPLAPETTMALSENGIDTRRLIPRTLTPELLAAADLVVTLSTGRRSRVKLPPTTRRREHWTIADPTLVSAKARAQAVRKGAGLPSSARTRAAAVKRDALLDARAIRDALRARVAMLVFSEGWGRPGISREEARVTRSKPVARKTTHKTTQQIAHQTSAPFGNSSEGMVFSFIAEASPGWFAIPSLSPPSLR